MCSKPFRLGLPSAQSKHNPTSLHTYATLVRSPFFPQIRVILNFTSTEIFAIPQVQRSNRLTHHPGFIGECAEALKHCHNLISLKMTVPGAVTYFLPSIRDKTRLETLSLHANLMTQQSESLLSLPGIKTLEIHFGSWSVADVLPRWTQMSLHHSLRHLTLYVSFVPFLSLSYSRPTLKRR